MIEIDLDKTHSTTCRCCGAPSTTLVRFVYEDGNAHALYYASFCPSHAQRVVKVALSFGEWGEAEVPADRRVFALEIRAGAFDPEIRLVDAAQSPWSGAEPLGRMLDREEGLGHPWFDKALVVTERMVVDDPPLSDYLRGESSVEA